MTDLPRVNDVTGLLLSWRQGDAAALDRLVPLVYDELRRVRAAISVVKLPGTPCRRRLSCTRSSSDSSMWIA
jgi:hypothetical protein